MQQSDSPSPSEAGPYPRALSARCPACGHELWQDKGGEWVIDSAAVKLVGGRFVAKCGRRGAKDGCGATVPIPWLRVVSSPTEDGQGGPRQTRRVRLGVRRVVVPG